MKPARRGFMKSWLLDLQKAKDKKKEETTN